jgi:ubiquinone/menaquinone biosynthesis C-methylase UbiE
VRQKTGETKILEAGCGTGLLAKLLEKRGYVVTGVDYSREAVAFCKKRGLNAKVGSVSKLPFKSNTFNGITCIDVIVHKSITDDVKVFKELYRLLKPGGILIVRLSANPWLHLSHDDFVHIRERYEPAGLTKKLHKAKLKILKMTYVHLPLLPLVMLNQLHHILTQGNKPASGIAQVPNLINSFLTTVLSREAEYLIDHNLKAGLALVVVCQKRL